jgi:hypothetical protein
VNNYENLGNPDDDEIEELFEVDEDQDQAEDEQLEDYGLDADSQAFVDELIKRIIIFCEEFAGLELRPYQRSLAYRIVESLVMVDGEEITALWSRQSGKSETLSVIVAGCMVILPKLAMSYETLERFKRGLWVGIFAPVDSQSDFLHGRIVDKLTSEHAMDFLSDPELDERVDGKSKVIRLRSGSLCRRSTANPRAKIEGASYHLVVIDEAQEADDTMVRKSIHPMLAAYAGTMVKIGTPSFHKGDFYKAIQLNKRRSTKRRSRVNHFEYDYRTVGKYNPYYAKFIQQEKIRLGEDSDEFQMCVGPNTRVLTADLRHILASEVTEGMELVGFDEFRPKKGTHRNFKKAVVESVWEVTRPSYKLSLSDGTEVISSEEHPWLVMTAGSRTKWKYTKDLAPTDRIFKITEVWDTAHTYESGYLASAFDGEGHLTFEPMQLGFSQKDNPMMKKVKEYLDQYNFLINESRNKISKVNRLNIGGRAEMMRFVGQIRPHRLLEKLDIDRIGSIGRHDRRNGGFDHPYVVDMEFIGDQKLVAFQTSTRTFIAEGLASHNSYNLKWQLDRGMLVAEDDLDFLADPSMPLVKSWHRTPCVVGIDPARVKDSTVVTVCWVDWDFPDPAGFREHRILNWMEIHNTEWEEQYFQIVDFLSNYNIAYVGVDAQGMGSAVAERLKRLLEHRCEVIPVSSDIKTQSERWKHLIALLQRRMIVYPGHSKARRTRVWRRFRQQMEDAEKVIKGNYMMIQAPPDERDSHDDYVDSLAIACAMSINDTTPYVETFEAPWFR